MSRYGQIFTCGTCKFYGEDGLCYKSTRPGGARSSKRPACSAYEQDVSLSFRWDFARQMGFSDDHELYGHVWSAEEWAAGTIDHSTEGGTDD